MRVLLALFMAIAFFATANAGEAPVFAIDGIAIRGYDSVAYHTENKPVPGSADYTFEYKGATWQFASAANRDKFAADPERYAPAYGGYCAYGMSKVYAVKTEPDAFKVHNGQLYMNYNTEVLATWKKDPEGYIVKADENVKEVLGE
ncbi:MAG: YHS domain-containing protein [Xanthomonadales bacterium]|nr:YHS domain-containing protein [Xanthomonadales bacterium]